MGRKKNSHKDLGVVVVVPSRSLGAASSSANNIKESSDMSDIESIAYSSVAGDLSTEDEDVGNVDVLIDSFAEQIENALDKKIATRMKAIDNIHLLLKQSSDDITGMAEKWKMTLCEIVEKNLKRTPEEAVKACWIAALLCLQLGVEVEDDIVGSLNTMRSICADVSVNENLRSVCAQSLGICIYLSCEQFAIRHDCMQALKGVWATMKTGSTQSALFSATLLSWVLLLERCDSQLIATGIEEVQPRLCGFLDSASVDMRIAAGEALAILFEVAVDNVDEDFRFNNHEHLKDVLGDLAIDSAKYHAKRDKRVQKFSFRQINDAIFNDRVPHSVIRFNKRESLSVDGCHMKLLYDLLCLLLKGGINGQLSKNEVLRELFDLGPVIMDDEPLKSKSEKTERMNLLGAVSKARNIHRSKQRDKKGC